MSRVQQAILDNILARACDPLDRPGLSREFERRGRPLTKAERYWLWVYRERLVKGSPEDKAWISRWLGATKGSRSGPPPLLLPFFILGEPQHEDDEAPDGLEGWEPPDWGSLDH